MSKKDAAIIKALAELGLKDDPELSPEQEEQLRIASDPELQYLQDVEDLFAKSPEKG